VRCRCGTQLGYRILQKQQLWLFDLASAYAIAAASLTFCEVPWLRSRDVAFAVRDGRMPAGHTP